MVNPVVKYQVTGASRVTNNPITVTGGGEGFDGSTQVIVRAPYASPAQMQDSFKNLPPEGEGFDYFAAPGTSESYTEVIYRTINSGSPRSVVPSINTNSSGAYDVKFEVVLDGEYEIIDWVNLPKNGSAQIRTASGGHLLVFHMVYKTSTAFSSIPQPDGYSLISASSPRYMMHNLSYMSSTGDGFSTAHGTSVNGNYVTEKASLTLSFAPKAPSGKTFQIMHNGQLIPATPNLWSGGQLTPVGLNLPE